MKTKYFILWFLALGFGSVITQGQSRYEFIGQPLYGSARTAGLGGSAAGEASDISALYTNPSALSFIRQEAVMFSSCLGGDNSSLENTVAFPLWHLSRTQVIAFGLSESSYGKSWSKPFFNYQGLDFAYSLKLHESFSLGLTYNVRYGNMSSKGLWTSSGSIGGFYQPSPGISYGFIFDGIGTGITYKYSNNAGSLSYQNLQQGLRIGTAFKFPSLYRAPYIVISMESEKIFGRKKLVYSLGLEVFPLSFLSLRSGLITNSSSTGGTIGLGVKAKQFTIDYALTRNAAILQQHRISITYNFQHLK